MDYFKLTTPQNNIWNLQKYYEDTAISNLCGAVFYEETRDTKLLRKAINQVIKNQTALRLQFVHKDGDVKQYIKEYVSVDIPMREFTDDEEFDRYAKKCASEPIGLLERDMYRFEIIVVGKKKGILAVLSHLISDAWTFSLLVKEIDKAYQNLIEGKEIKNICNDYIRYVQAEADYLNSDKYKKDESYWKEKYVLKPENSAIKLGMITKDSVKAKRLERKLSFTLTEDIKNYCMKNVLTPAVLFETALYIYLFKINPDHNAVTVGIPVLNRTKAYEKKTAGMFVSTVPLTIEVSEGETVKQLEKRITDTHTQIFRHQKYPYSMILKYLREKQNFEGNLYDVMFSFQNAETDTASATKWYSNGYSEVPFTLHVDNRDNNDTYTLTIDYQVVLFKEEKEVNDIITRLEYVIKQIIENDQELIKEIAILTDDEKQRILFEFNDTVVDYPRDKCVHELFMEQAKKTPDAVALVFEDKKITYRELDEMSNGLALELRKKGVKKGDYVGVLLDRDEKVIFTQLAVLKLGAVFIPIDSRYPAERIEYIVNNSNVKILIKNSKCTFIHETVIDMESLAIMQIPIIELEKVDAGDICYVIFTSGSTGLPKGCTLSNRGLVNFCKNNNILESCNSLKKQIAVSVNTISFDYFIAESLLPLVNGYTVVLAGEEESVNQDKFIELLTKTKANIIQTTPTRYKIFFDKKRDISFVEQFDIFVTSGEALPFDLLKMFCQNRQAKVFNPLGPSECSVWIVGGELHWEGEVKEDDITIGKPIANTQIYILDKHGNPVPIGVPGELCIAGDGVGLGYLNRPDLTAERFVSNPFATEKNGHGKTMYHTGDLAAWRENGEIEYLGRIDTQVKIRGLRIELGEIESVMSEFSGIRMCAVTDKKDKYGRQYLVGYYTTISDEKENPNITTTIKVDEKELRKYLSTKLPRYMVPNYFMRIAKMPMTPSGKTDRKNLPMPEMKDSTIQEYIKPVTEQESILCNLMEEVLGYTPIGTEHDFFFCGGDSLKAMEFIIKAEDKGIRLQLQEIFDHSTVAELTKFLRQREIKEKKEVIKEYTFEHFEKYQSLLENNKIASLYDMQEQPVKSVLLSGITGFLGVHIADSLLQDEKCIIYCLVRSKEPEDRRGRLPKILEHYFGNKYTDMIGTRIIPVVGDITKENLSDELPEKVDMVIHAAATVKHYGSYDYFYRVNTMGTKHMAEYALRTGARFIHISTLSVSGNAFVESFDAEAALEERYFNEKCLYQGQSLKNVYVRSKFEAECVVLDAMMKGLQANIIRVGNLTNRSKDYIFQPNYMENAFLSRIRSILELCCLPDYILSLNCEFSPVNDTADAIVRIAKHFNTTHTVFHVYSDQNLYFDRMIEILRKLGFDMKVVNKEIFNQCLKESVNQNKTYIYEAFMNDMNTDNKLNYETNIHIQNDFTISYLKQLGFEWTKIDYDYLKGYIEYFQKLEYFKRGKTDEK